MPHSDTTEDQTASETETSPSEPSPDDGRPDFKATVERLIAKRQVSEAEIEQQAEAEAFASRFEVIKQDGVPKRIRRQLHGIEKTRPILRVEQFIGEQPDQWCLVLSSNPGTGKSTAAAYWLWNISPERSAAPGASIRRWWSACELATVSAYSGELDLLKGPGPLVLDDLGTEYMDKHGHFSRVLDDLVDARYREELPTLITTNLNRAAFLERYDQRIADRIREGGAFFEFSAESMRGKP